MPKFLAGFFLFQPKSLKDEKLVAEMAEGEKCWLIKIRIAFVQKYKTKLHRWLFSLRFYYLRLIKKLIESPNTSNDKSNRPAPPKWQVEPSSTP